MASSVLVVVFLQSEGVDRHGGATPIGGAAQDAGARGVVDVELCVGGACVPTDEVVEQVVGEGGRGAAVGAAGDVAIAVVAAGVDLPCFGGAGGTGAVEAG